MSDVDDHTLNACLARVIGVEVFETGYPALFQYRGPNYPPKEWDPLHDANQMEEVEEGLKRMDPDLEYDIAWNSFKKHYEVCIQRFREHKGLWEVEHPDKKRAFAMVVQAMEQSNNNNNKED